MLRRTTELIERHATPRGIASAVAISLLCGVLPLSYALSRIRAGSPDAAPLDMASSYTPDQAYTMLARYSADARDYYVFNAFTADIVAPALFGLTVALLSVALLRPITAPGSRWRALAVLGALAGLAADGIENLLLATLVVRFPERHDGLAELANLATIVKRSIIFSTWAFALLAALALALRRWTGPRRSQ